MRLLTPDEKEIAEFKQLYLQLTNRELSDVEARETATQMAHLCHMPDDEIWATLNHLLDNHFMVGSLLYPPLTVYRGRATESLRLFSGVEDLSYPPGGSSTYQRSSKPGQKLFYCSDRLDAMATESRVRPGQFLCVGDWETTTPMLTSTIGFEVAYPTALIEKIDPKLIDVEASRKTMEFLKVLFLKLSDTPDVYRVSASIASFFLGEIGDKGPAVESLPNQFDALNYPSSIHQALGNNLAIRSEYVDKSLILKKVQIFHVPLQPRVQALPIYDGAIESDRITWNRTSVDERTDTKP